MLYLKTNRNGDIELALVADNGAKVISIETVLDLGKSSCSRMVNDRKKCIFPTARQAFCL
jgi:hypothetical protein